MRWPDESVERPALPLGELVQPAPMLAVALLLLNDHVLKGAAVLPGWLTGKISDFAGLFFFPLLGTALFDTAAALTGLPIDWTLRRRKILVSIGLTVVGFTALELSAAAVDLYVGALGALGIAARSTRDPTDLLALPCLGLSWLVARRHLRGVPSGRAHWALLRRRAGVPIARSLADVAHLQRTDAGRAAVEELITALEDLHARPDLGPGRADEALARVRLLSSLRRGRSEPPRAVGPRSQRRPSGSARTLRAPRSR